MTVDDLPWRWADASGQSLVVNGLPSGPHKIRIELTDATHKVIDRHTITFVVH